MGDHGGPRKMKIEASSFQFMKCINMIHFYSCISIAIFGSIVFYCNVFIGEAELREIPEGYVPKYWEYFSVSTAVLCMNNRFIISMLISRSFYRIVASYH